MIAGYDDYERSNWKQFRTVCLLCGAYVTPDDNGDILHACNGRGVDILPKPLDAIAFQQKQGDSNEDE